MEELPAQEIREKALGYHREGEPWHFHVLTPSCKFNTKREYAVPLEGPEGNFVCYFESSPSELGQELAPLAHKADVLNQSTADTDYQPSATIRKIIARAQELNAKQVEWHHHVTFRGCQYHTGGSNFVLVFEGPETGESIESPSDEEPINDLKQIEPLFYAQRPPEK